MPPRGTSFLLFNLTTVMAYILSSPDTYEHERAAKANRTAYRKLREMNLYPYLTLYIIKHSYERVLKERQCIVTLTRKEDWLWKYRALKLQFELCKNTLLLVPPLRWTQIDKRKNVDLNNETVEIYISHPVVKLERPNQIWQNWEIDSIFELWSRKSKRVLTKIFTDPG